MNPGDGPIQRRIGKNTITYFSAFREPETLLRDLTRAPAVPDKGRGGIRVAESEGLRLAVRQYRHGGLFRAFTGPRFVTSRRAMREAAVTGHLREKGFCAVEPFCVIAERHLLSMRLYLATTFQENKGDLLQCLITGSRRERLRLVRRFAEGLWLMEQAGVYHPDLHLRNVLVTPGGDLVFLDFDKATVGQIGLQDVVAMFRRLGRFAEKMQKEGRFSARQIEKALFLRTYRRLSGRDLTAVMEASATRRQRFTRLGWFVESLLYGER